MQPDPKASVRRALREVEQEMRQAEADLVLARAQYNALRSKADDLRKFLERDRQPARERRRGPVPDLRLMQSRKAAVLEVLRATGTSMSINEVLAALREGGRKVEDDWYAVVATTLHHLRQEGKIETVGRGTYRFAS